MLARLKGMTPSAKPEDVANSKPPEPAVAVAPPKAEAPKPAPVATAPAPAAPPKPAAAGAGQVCHICQTPRKGAEEYCEGCGFFFPPPGSAPAGNGSPGASNSLFVKNRYELAQLLSERGNVQRFKGTDRGNGSAVVILRSPAPAEETAMAAEEMAEAVADDEMVPTFDGPAAEAPEAEAITGVHAAWPSLGWEANLLEDAKHPALPRILDRFVENGQEYLIEEVPAGELLWNAWDDPEKRAADRYTWLKQVAEALREIHKCNAIIEGLRPDIITVREDGQAVINDLTDLLPLPLPPSPPIRGTLYTAPELVAARANTDARADLYSFGAMMYALTMGYELTDNDFDKKSGLPKNFIARLPDVHPLLGRIVSKTFCRDPQLRFPTDEAGKKDATGFTELIGALETCARTMDNCRMEVASWTTTGIVRTGNEDAFALVHATESYQDDMTDYCLVLLADGMGGYEAGEVAAHLCIQTLRKTLTGHRFYKACTGSDHPEAGEFDVEECKKVLMDALREANDTVHKAPTKGIGRRGMGCTAEALYIDGQNLVVGHVGDSRTYHLSQGRMIQVTRDQTLVNRLVELGQIRAEDAESHPRKNELQQAIGGRAFVEPAVYSAKLKPGDWVLVCSDGLSNHIKSEEMQEMMQSEATSAEIAARRLVNFVNLRGATDNATIVVVRLT